MGDKDKLVKPGKESLTKQSGAPDFFKLKGQKGAALSVSTKLQTLTTGTPTIGSLNASLQVVMMFDITGSMFEYFDLVRKKLRKIIEAVKKESPSAQFAIFAYRNHGDEDSYEQIFYTSPLTVNLEELDQHIAKIQKGGGGPDALTCMEDCLREANKLSWFPNTPKALVIIGDMPPHGVIDSVSKCPNEIDYREEVKRLQGKKIKIYTVYCGEHKGTIKEFYQNLPLESGGKYLEISEIDVLVELMIGICMKETGNLDKFINDLKATNQLSVSAKKALLMLQK